MSDDDGPLTLSELQELTVTDVHGEPVGDVADVVCLLVPEPPVVSAFIAQHDDEQLRVRWDQVSALDLDGHRLRLNVPRDELEPVSLRAEEIALVDAVLDHQVLDVEHLKLVRVQDVALKREGGKLVVAGVDTSGGTALRRLGLGFLVGGARRPEQFLSWDDVNLISLRLSRANFAEAFAELAKMRPADIAEVLHQVAPRERAAVLAALNPALAADTLQELDEALRGPALADMPPTRAAAVLAEIDPDEAADILAQLPEDTAERLLDSLPEKQAAVIRGLAVHPEHSAGGLMTTDFVLLFQGMTVAEALEYIRSEKPEADALSYIYVNDAQGRLCGVVSLRDLVLARPDQRLEEIMDDDPVTVLPDEDEEEVGRLMTRYNLLALPVVDEGGHMLGVVTLDDALDALVPEEWKARLPRLFR